MKKVNIFSVFLFITVALLIYGFSFTKVSAEEDVAFIEVSGDITGGTIWAETSKPYVVTNDITVGKGATLTIKPGVVVKFDNGAILKIDGRLEAQGTSIAPIYFTSIYDDEVGGDINKDHEDFEDCYYDSYDEEWNGIGDEICKTEDIYQPSDGDWGYIFIDSSTEQSILNNVVQKYSDEGIILYNGGSVVSDNFNSDQGVSAFGSNSTFSHLIVPYIYLFAWDKGEGETKVGSTISIDEQSLIINENDSSIIVEGSSSLTLKNSKVEGAGFYTISIYSNSSAVFDSVEISGSETDVSENSSLEINNSSITNNNGDGFQIFQNSTLNATDLSVECKKDGISVFSNSSLNLSGGSISCIDHGIYIFSESKADINNVKISGALGNEYYYGVGLVAHSNTGTNGVTITKSEITGNEYGFQIWDSLFSAHKNSIHGNTNKGADTFSGIDLDFSSNFWGDKSGPTHSTNPSGTGDVVSDNITFTDFLKYDPTKERKDPIIIVPGIMGTELIRDYGDTDEIWPSVVKLVLSFFDNYLRDLELLTNGDKNIDFPIVIGDIIRETPTSNIFGGLITYLTTTGNYIENENLFVFPYDWRLSNKESARLLKEKINQILIDTDEDKVDVIAHSMGGLVAKKYIIDDDGKNKIDQLIFLGTPHLGAPKAFKALMYGDDMGTNFGFLSLLNPGVVKDISQNMPSIYELLPSNQYIKNLGEYMSYKGIYMGYDQTKDYMTLNNKNKLMFPYAEELHDGIDSLDLSGVNVYNFANCDKYTIGEIGIMQKIKKGLFGTTTEDDYRLSYKAGDETVPFISANAEDYGTKYFTKGISHAELPSAEGVKETILSILKNETPNDFDNIATTYSDSYCKTSGKVPSVHSPVSMDIYDELGNHTGPNENGDIEYGIPGVAYDVIGDKKFAFLPDGEDYKVVTKALDIGSYDFYIDSFNINDEKVNTVEFLNIPLTSLNTNAVVDINESITEYKVLLDKEGDGIFESTLNPGDNAPVEKKKGSSGSYILNNLLFQPSNILEPINVLIGENREELKEEEAIPIIKDLEKREEVKSEMVVNNIDKITQVNNLSASVGSINFDLDKRFILLINIVLSGLIIFVGIKFINKVK